MEHKKLKTNHFEIIVKLEDGCTKEIHDINLPSYVSKFISSNINNKNMYCAIVEIDSIKQIQDLGYYFDGDMVVSGIGMNVITTFRTAKELEANK